jgi:Fic family protein
LNYLQEQKFILKTGSGRGVKYSIADVNKIFLPIDSEKYFTTPYLERDVKENFNFKIFEILKNDIFTTEEKEKIAELQTEFIKNFSKYDSQTLINKEFERIMIEFSWKSSAIEGNTYSLLSTEALIKENIEAEGKTKEEAQMILNHKDAFNEAIQNKQRFRKLDYKDIEYVHSVLTKGLNITKSIRSSSVGIIGTKYKPLDNAHQIKEALEKTVKLINNKENFFEKAFLVLILLSYIQAFEDGNKRTARMISNALLLSFDSIPLSYRAVSVEEYKKASLLFYEQNNISYFKQIFIEQFEDAVKNFFN